MKAAFICVNYNNSKITQEYIINILEIKHNYDLKIIIVDNASKEEDISNLSAYINKIDKEEVILLKSSINLGYFKGLNLGINSLKKEDYDYIIIGNNDLSFQNDFLLKLEKKRVENDILVIAPNIIRLDGIHQNPHIIKKFGTFTKVYRRIYFTNYYVSVLIQYVYNAIRSFVNPADRVGFDKECIITMGYGACYILTTHFFKKFNELDAPNFLMGEEGVLANQVLSVEGKTLYMPDLVVRHHDHSSIGKISNKKLYSFSRESYFYYLKHLKHIQ
ncbi:MAG TPA: glycosyltransferase [Flavobacterium sp.]|jgi:GT2 family glycosyltransferase